MSQSMDEHGKSVAPYPRFAEGINILRLWQILFERKWSIFLIVVTVTVIAVVYALKTPSIYRAEVLMVSVKDLDDSGRGIGSIADQLGGFASLTGIGVGGGRGSTQMALAVLQSRTFIQRFINENEIKGALFDIGRDVESDIKKSSNETIESMVEKEIRGENSETSSDWAAYKVMKGITFVNRNDETGLVTYAVEWHDPKLASKWANKAVLQLNSHLRRQAIEEAQNSIRFLENELTRTSLVSTQRVLYSLIEEQMKNIMLANVRTEYAFKVIDPAVPPEDRVRPARRIIVSIGFLLGLVLGLSFALIRNIFSDNGKYIISNPAK